MVLQDSNSVVLAGLGTTAFLIAAVFVVIVEARFLAGRSSTTQLVYVMVVLRFVAEVILGAALLRSGLTRAWVGWTAVAWNIGWLFALPLVRQTSTIRFCTSSRCC